ncbi:hypothetical protein K438DRAFT_1755449 [Mycena galopus ATCC 62051]|nr:hypothetical protein K438DRAFT_1755449 [Mycena galopus ATCC 62051]
MSSGIEPEVNRHRLGVDRETGRWPEEGRRLSECEQRYTGVYRKWSDEVWMSPWWYRMVVDERPLTTSGVFEVELRLSRGLKLRVVLGSLQLTELHKLGFSGSAFHIRHVGVGIFGFRGRFCPRWRRHLLLAFAPGGGLGGVASVAQPLARLRRLRAGVSDVDGPALGGGTVLALLRVLRREGGDAVGDTVGDPWVALLELAFLLPFDIWGIG